ncbi:uncharacterized protein LOC123537744 [Mercenaria mercenaria]|uniref:uncharacterized protein LOC123537744 n=1 Tax=Mercenaria mercenaria TaxID=6596 RepID=UPI00234F83D5|nr:uncharacterized protein LOC123537744 [Mercenaria mercenaria]
MYHQFFESHRRNSHVTACMTHHTVWSRLKDISHSGHFCQKDIIFHLNYAFEHHPDNCTCKEDTHRTQSHSSHGDHDCHHYDSFNKLWQLGETDGCLSANSVWHYLDDIQVKDPVCRQKIQHHLAGKYKHATSQDDDNCICNERRQLVNHQIHKMSNGSLIPCLNANGTYPVIEADLFSNISASGCQNHNYLWTKLEGVHNHCKWTINHHCSKETDCTEDIIVRAAIQYPTDESDSCICTKASSSTVFTTSSSKHPTPVVPSSSEAPMPTLTAPSTTSANQHVTVSSAKVTQSSTAMPTPQTSPTIRFACNKVAVVEKIAKSLIATHPNSSACKSNVTGGSDDAYVLATCNVMSPITWGKGANVMADCESSIQSVPTYTPISTFYGDIYNPLVDQPGIFLGCFNNGIKIAIQKCNAVPEIVHIENGTFVSNPKNYYLIV